MEDLREPATFAHAYKPGTLVTSFHNSSVECADEDAIRQVTTLMKQAGADILCIGGGSRPENVHQMSVTARGLHHTCFRMASVNG